MRNPVLAAATERVRSGLLELNQHLAAEDLPLLEGAGQLIRPLVALAANGGEEPDERFWWAAAAVQLAHEASLVHDDIIDTAEERRGEPTAVARAGIAGALVQGDHLLTTAYRLAARTGSLAFATRFARAVERTVAGEREQGIRAGDRLTREEYQSIVLGKSGELLGCAFAIPATLSGAADADLRFETGRRIGLFYQMLDDLLDYCADARTGKQPFRDWTQRRWTWPLFHVGDVSFGLPAAELRDRFFATHQDSAPAQRCLDEIDEVAARLGDEVGQLLPDDAVLRTLLEEWRSAAHIAISGDEMSSAAGAQPGTNTASSRSTHAVLVPQIVSDEFRDRLSRLDWQASLPRHGRSFAFASRWFPADQRDRVSRVYAYCRFTDDLVDDAGARTVSVIERDLDEWLRLSRSAYDGHLTGHAFLDEVMRDAAHAAVPFRHVEQLTEGVRMDLRAVRFETLGDLQGYTYRVASVVGLWMCALFGVRRTAVLARAATLGHAMQITNILRDVGEDLGRDRLYLPRHIMQENGVTREQLEAMRSGAPITQEYRALIEELMAVAEVAYDAAFLAIPELPRETQSPIAVASFVYRGIHDAIRRNEYDNLTVRAHTNLMQKARLAAIALRTLRRVAAERPLAEEPERAARQEGRVARSFAH